MYRESARSALATAIFFTIVLIALMLVGLVVSGVHYSTLPFFLNQETTAYDNSRAAVEGRNTLMLKLVQDASDPNTSPEQKQAIMNRLRAEAARQPADQVPPSVNQLLRRGS